MRWILLVLYSSVAFGCSASDSASTSSATASAKSSAAGAGHAPRGVTPGSHEDWCGEHGVPESQCTSCNPALIPAFKATKDWCERARRARIAVH
jgi:hypothetical protein